MFRINQHSPESAYLGTISRDITELVTNCVGNPSVVWGFTVVQPWCVSVGAFRSHVLGSWLVSCAGPQLLCSISGRLCRCKGSAEILHYAWILRIWAHDMTVDWWSFICLNMSRFIEQLLIRLQHCQIHTISGWGFQREQWRPVDLKSY